MKKSTECRVFMDMVVRLQLAAPAVDGPPLVARESAVHEQRDHGPLRAHGARLDEIEAAYVASSRRLCGVVAGIVGDAETAEDVVQETFARAVARRWSFQRIGSVEGWLWRVCMNTALNHVRKERRKAPSPVLPLAADAVAGEPNGDAVIRAAVSSLPERQRAVLFLHYYADLDYSTIAQILSLKLGTVGKMLHDARRTLRSSLEVHGREG